MVHKVRNQRAETLEAGARELQLLDSGSPQQGADSFRPWPIRRRRIGINAACPRDSCASCRRNRPELFGKSRLPDTGLSANPNDTRRAALAFGESAGKDGEFEFSADELKRRTVEHSVFGVDALRPRQPSAPPILRRTIVCRPLPVACSERTTRTRP